MTQLAQRAKHLREERNTKLVADSENIKIKADKERKRLLEEFEAGFGEVLAMLTEAGIEYAPGLIDEKYFAIKGTYISLKRGEKEIKMDFSNRNSYRYEFTGDRMAANPIRGNGVFGKWPMDDFVLWIYDELGEDNKEKA